MSHSYRLKILFTWILASTFINLSSQTLWGVGRNVNSQLAIGGTTDQTTFNQVGTANNWWKLSLGQHEVAGITADSVLYTWGRNYIGQLGINTLTNTDSPSIVSSGSKWIDVTMGLSDHSQGIKSDGTLWGWGNGQFGKTGLGGTTNYSTPQKVGTDTDWKTVVSGHSYSLAIKTNGTLYSWGRRYRGVLARGYTTSGSAYYATPSQVSQTGITNNDWVYLATGYWAAYAIKSDGTLWSWGYDLYGELGRNVTSNTASITIAQIGSATWTMVSSSNDNFAVGLQTDGTIWSWGRNNLGQLGIGSTTDYKVPQKIGSDSNWAYIYSGNNFAMALKTDGTLWAWGTNSYLGINSSSPVKWGTNTNWAQIKASQDYAFALVSGYDNIWTGTGNYTTTSNWSESATPGNTDRVQISAGTLTINQKTQLSSMNVSSGATVVLNDTLILDELYTESGAILKLNGHDLVIGNPSNMDGMGGTDDLFIEGNSSSNLTIYDNDDQNLVLMNSKIDLASLCKKGTSGATLTIKNGLIIHDSIHLTDGGTFATNSCTVTLASSINGTAAITATNGTISADIILQQYVPGRRVFRFLGNPMNTSLPLSQLTDDIDITGTGGSNNGFSNTTKNNPSAFYFDVDNANNESDGLNPGWTAFSNTSSTSNWPRYGAALIYVRGEKGQGIDGNAYTPSATTIDISGNVNYGDQTITLTKGANTDFITVANPFPAAINLGNIQSSQRNNLGNSFYVFDANLGNYGGYITRSWGSDYILPSLGAFVTTLSATGSMVIKESDKSTGTPDNIFTEIDGNQKIILDLFVGNQLYEQTTIIKNAEAFENLDYYDAEKMDNAGLNFYSIATDNTELSIDARSFDKEITEIPLGLWTEKEITLTIEPQLLNMEGFSVILKDLYLNKSIPLDIAAKVSFTLNPNDNSSHGNNRFVLIIQKKKNHTSRNQHLNANVYPNPSHGHFHISANDKIYEYRILNIQGSEIQNNQSNNQTDLDLNLTHLPNGPYFIEILTSQGSKTQLVIKH